MALGMTGKGIRRTAWAGKRAIREFMALRKKTVLAKTKKLEGRPAAPNERGRHDRAGRRRPTHEKTSRVREGMPGRKWREQVDTKREGEKVQWAIGLHVEFDGPK